MPGNNTALDDAEGFKAALLCEDDIGKVIRTHICIELVLNGFIEFALPNQSYLKQLKLEYSGKVYLAGCMGLNEELLQPLLQIGSIRNKFAHRPNQIIDINIVNNFYASFSGRQKTIIKEISNSAGLQNEEGINEKFISLAMALFYLLKIDVANFTQSTKIKELLQAIGGLHASDSESEE